MCFFFFKQKTAYEMRISDWSSDVCSSDLPADAAGRGAAEDCCRLRCVGLGVLRAPDAGCEAGDRAAGPGARRAGAHRAAAAGCDHRAAGGAEPAERPRRRAGFRRMLGSAPDLLRRRGAVPGSRSEEHTSELQSLMRISYAVFCLQKKQE